jgi:hypothetical protein
VRNLDYALPQHQLQRGAPHHPRVFTQEKEKAAIFPDEAPPQQNASPVPRTDPSPAPCRPLPASMLAMVMPATTVTATAIMVATTIVIAPAIVITAMPATTAIAVVHQPVTTRQLARQHQGTHYIKRKLTHDAPRVGRCLRAADPEWMNRLARHSFHKAL